MKLRKKEIKLVNYFNCALLILLIIVPFSILTFFLFLFIIFFLIYINLLIQPVDNNNKIEIKFNISNIDESIDTSRPLYQIKPLMTKTEYKFYKKLSILENTYIILPQLCLISIIKKNYNNKHINELFRIIDFAVFSKDYKELLLLIELNDKTHNSFKRKERDNKVNSLCKIVNVKLITFYTKYSNTQAHVVSRILREIKYNSNDNTNL